MNDWVVVSLTLALRDSPGLVGLLVSHAIAGFLGMVAVLVLARLSTYLLKNM